MAGFKIRKTKLEDAKEYIALHNLVWRDAYKNILPERVFDLREKNTQKRIDGFKQYNISNGERLCLVAIADGKIVGLMHGTLLTQYEHFAKQGYAELQAIYIHPNYQRMHIATRLKDEFEKWAKKNGATKYVVGVLAQNERARKVYKHWGGKLSRRVNNMKIFDIDCEERFYTFDL